MMKKALIAVMAAVLGVNLFAKDPDPYNNVVYSNSKDVEPGKWFSNFDAVLKYANDNNVPMVVFWGSEGCGHCAKVEKQMAKSGFTDWMKESGLVFAFVVAGVTPGGTAKTPKLYARYGSEFPYVGVYWKENTKGNKVGGKAKDGQTNFPSGHFGGRIGEKSWSKLKNKIVSYIPDWTPVKGGLFDIDETKEKSAGNRLEVSKESGTVLISLTRPTSAVQKACDDDIMRVTYKDGTVVSNILSWAAGQSTMEYSLALDAGKLKAGEAVTLEMLNGPRVVSTSSVTVVSDENSAANPLWIGERTVAEPAKTFSLKSAPAATPLQFGEWTMDLDVATQTVAKANGDAYTLVSLQGSLWCPDCANTERNFLSLTKDSANRFAKWASDHQVALVSIDLPSVSADDPEGKGSTCLLSRNVASAQLVRNRKDDPNKFDDYPAINGGDPNLAKPLPYSGAGYMSRKGITAAAAAACLSNNLWLAKTNTDQGGFHRPDDGNSCRPGVPGFVLLRKDGSVAARFQRFASVSPMKFDKDGKEIATDNFDKYIKRFNEMIEIADSIVDPDDASEIENSYPSASSIPVTNGDTETGANGRLCNADFKDTFKIVGMTGSARQIAYVTGESDAVLKAQFYIRKADGTIAAVGDGQTNMLSGGVSLTADIPAATACFVMVSGDDITCPEFDAASDNPTFVPYTVKTRTEKLLPQEGAATIAAASGTVFKVELVQGQDYRFVGIDTNLTGFTELFTDKGNGIYTALKGGEQSIGVTGDLTYQKWVPGTVSITPADAEMKESDTVGVKVEVKRASGTSGEVKLRIRVDRAATDCFYDNDIWGSEFGTYKTMPRFTVNDKWDILTDDEDFYTDITYPDGFAATADVATFVVKPIDIPEFKKYKDRYFGDATIVLRLKVLSGQDVKLAGEDPDTHEATCVITIKDNTKQQKPGKVQFKEGASLFSKTGPYTVYARQSSSIGLTLARVDAMDGAVRTKFTQSKGGKLIVVGEPVDDEGTLGVQWWGNGDNDDKVITVTNLPAVGKSTTLTLSPVSPLKVKSSSTKAVKVVSVADDATEFEEREYCFSNLLRYVSCTCPCKLKETGSGTLSAKKLRGSIPSGLSAKLLTEVSEDESTTNTVLCFSGYPTKAGTYTAYYQVVENRGTKKKPKNYGGLPMKVVFKVYDPVTAGKSADPAIAAIANPSVASTRTLNDLMVFGPYAETNRLAGKLKLTIPRSGKVSAKYVCNGGTISFSAKGWEPKDPYAGEVSGELTATLTATKKAWTNYTLTVTAETNGAVTASIADPYYEGTELEAWSDGQVWTAGDKKKKIPAHTAKPWKGQYTVSLMPAGTWVDVDGGASMQLPGMICEPVDGLAPRGAGYLTLKMTSSSAYNAGKMTWGGKLPDGTSVSGTTVLTEELAVEEDAEDPEWEPTYAFLPVFTRFSTKVSKSVTTYDRLSLIARIVRDGATCPRAVMPAESLARGEWVHQVTKPAAAAEALNFSMDIFSLGSFYDPKKSLKTCCEEHSVSANQKLYLETLGWKSYPGYFLPVDIDPLAITVSYTSKDVSKHTVKINAGQPNPRKVTLSLKRSTGVVSGSFKLPYKDAVEDVHTASAKWYGVLLMGWCKECECGEVPPEIEPEEGNFYLPFVNGGYFFSDTVPYSAEKGLSVKRGGYVWSEKAE